MTEVASQLVINLITIVIAAIALFYSIKSYKQSHKINNENLLYQEKITAYKEIMYALSDLLNTTGLYFELSYERLVQDNLNKADQKEFTEYSDNIDDKTNEFDNSIKANASILPNKILNKLETITFKLFELKPLINLEKHELSSYEKSLNQFFEDAEDLVNVFRKDLNTNALNQTLFKRIKNR